MVWGSPEGRKEPLAEQLCECSMRMGFLKLSGNQSCSRSRENSSGLLARSSETQETISASVGVGKVPVPPL